MAVNEKTSPKVAKIASKILKNLSSDKSGKRNISLYTYSGTSVCTIAELKTLAGSCLTQATDKPKKK